MKLIKRLIIFSLLFILTGCWDGIEIEEQAFVVTIGLDLGEDNTIDVTYQIANPQVGSTNIASSEKEPEVEVVTINSPDYNAAKELANIVISRRLNFTHVKAFIIGEELAKSDKIDIIIEEWTRDSNIQRKMHVIVSKEKAQDFINSMKPALESRPHKFFEFMSERWEMTGLVPDSTLGRFIHRYEDKTTAFISIYATNEETDKNTKPKDQGGEDAQKASTSPDDKLPGEVEKKSKNTVQIIGGAVFKEGKMIGNLTGREVRLSLLLRKYANSKTWIMTFDDPLKDDSIITTRIMKQSPEIKIKTDKKLKIDVYVPIKIEVLSIDSRIDYVTDQKLQKVLTDSLKTQLEKESMELVKKVQEEFQLEIFLWSLSARKNFPNKMEKKEYNWNEKFLKAEININYDPTIDNFGKQVVPIT